MMDSLLALSTPDNNLLAALPAEEWRRARQSFKSIFMPLGDVLYEAASRADNLYFPTTAIISVSCLMADGRADGLTLIGHEGFASIGVFLGANSAPCRAVVLTEGWGYRIRRELLGQVQDFE